ncbi:MAG: ABC transporter ATP-binding protein [Phaeodactylibacter sp.]|nr:ABC transporter ATP-binding protein [Phaeodactylibacter sp.]MCB9292176.1 ABC transporter ATP-binding protein [Lewinellaceae bacterium]
MDETSQYALQASGLTFAYPGSAPVFSGLDLAVPEGSVFGLLGANGIGKSTLMKVLMGLLPRKGGAVSLFGSPIRQEAFHQVGVLIEGPNLYPHLSGLDNLMVMATYRGVGRDRAVEVLELVGLEGHAGKLARHYSTGMKQRLGIAMALLHRPRLLLMDEPANGLDPAGIVDVRSLFRRLNREEGMTIFLSSHLLSEVEQSCTHLGILAPGRLAYQGALEGARRQLPAGVRLRILCRPADRALDVLRAAGLDAGLSEKGALQLPLSGKKEANLVIDLLRGANIDIYELATEEDSLEDFFLSLYQ